MQESSQIEMEVRPEIDTGYCGHCTALTLHSGRLCVDGVEHVGQHQEEGDKQPHPPGDHGGGDEEADPGDLGRVPEISDIHAGSHHYKQS